MVDCSDIQLLVSIMDSDKEPVEMTKKRRNPPWLDPSWEWGGGKYKIDGRKKFKKNVVVDKENENVENGEIHLLGKETSETNGGSCGSSRGVMELSLEDLVNEYNSLPPQIPEWFWCIEYVAKFHKDLRLILDLMNMGYPCRNDYGKRINEVLSLRILEFMFNDPKGKNIVDETHPRIEFDLSLSNVYVLNAILKEIPISELRRGMPELSKFNVLPFINHKNKNLPQCALEKMKDLGLMEKNQTNETPRPPSMEANDSAIRNDRYVEKEKNSIDEEDNNEDPSVICSKDGVWLIDDDESDYSNIASTSRSEKKNVCWKCKEEDKGTLLICSRKDCEAKVHKECMNCEVNFDEFGNFHCPVCWFDRVVEDYNVHLKMESDAKAKLVKFLPLLTKAKKRLMVQNAGK